MNPDLIINGMYIHYTCTNKGRDERYFIYRADEFNSGGEPVISIKISKNPLVDDLQSAIDFCNNYNR